MNRLSKGILLGTSLLVGGLLLAAVALRSTLQSESTRQRIQESLSHALHMDVRFERLRPTFFKGSRLSGFSASRAGGSSFSAHEVFVRPRLLSLLRGQFVLSEIRVEGARIVLVDRQKTEAQTAADAKNQASLVKHGKPRLAVRKLTIQDAAFDWFDSKGKARLQVEGIQLTLSHLGDESGDGTLRIEKGTLYEVLPFHDLQSPIQFSGDRYSLPSLHASSGSGTLEASVDATPSQKNIPLNLTLQAQEIDLARISEEIPAVQSTGKIQGRLEVHGLLQDPASLQGKGQLHFENGILKGFGVLQSIGQVFQISELTNLKVKQASCQFSIANRKLTLETLPVEANEISLSAPGEIDFDQHLQLNVQLALPESMLSGKILQIFSDRFAPPDENGRRAIGFQVTGTTDKPKTNLLEKLVGDSLGGALNKLLGGFLKPKKAERPPSPPDQPAAPAAPQTSADPQPGK